MPTASYLSYMFDIYHGDGSTAAERNSQLPPYSDPLYRDAPRRYIAAPALRDAVNVAISLGQPLLLTGEPGTGKTQLAYSVAYELGLDDPMVFNTKTTSTARDLFYRYDSLAHFHDAQLAEKGSIAVEDYITFEALGLAILKSLEKRSVVLIDEIDKAPRDLPNDLLNEFETLSFTVRETGNTYKAASENRPILILTSNSEKNLPEAFLRRVVYYHIPFPDPETLKKIVRTRLPLSDSFSEEMLNAAIEHFSDIRNNRGLRKRPATAELLAWIHILDRQGIDLSKGIESQIKDLAMTYAILAKNKDDLGKLQG
ncbi:MAG: AAA family ATPase [Bacteroidia bacterium]